MFDGLPRSRRAGSSSRLPVRAGAAWDASLVTLAELADFGTFLSAVAALLIALGAFVQLQLLRRQIRQGHEQLDQGKEVLQLTRQSMEHTAIAGDAAQDSAASARADVSEARWSRADAQSHRIVVLVEGPGWPPYVDLQRTSMPGSNEEHPLSEDYLERCDRPEPGKSYYFPRHEQNLMWFRGRAVVANEGVASARVSVSGYGRFVRGKSMLWRNHEVMIPTPATIRKRLSEEILLRPGEVALVEFMTVADLGTWAERSKTDTPVHEASVVAHGMTEHSVVDRIKLRFSGRPLEPDPAVAGGWRLATSAQNAQVGMVPDVSVRTYLSADRTKREPG